MILLSIFSSSLTFITPQIQLLINTFISFLKCFFLKHVFIDFYREKGEGRERIIDVRATHPLAASHQELGLQPGHAPQLTGNQTSNPWVPRTMSNQPSHPTSQGHNFNVLFSFSIIDHPKSWSTDDHMSSDFHPQPPLLGNSIPSFYFVMFVFLVILG